MNLAGVDPQVRLFCVHGFLGRAQDWDSILPKNLHRYNWDLFSSQNQGKVTFGFQALAKKINDDAARQAGPRLFVGYSFGGRVGLHALVQRPEIWDAAVIISAHPGLKDPAEREMRMRSDEIWAERFETQDWDLLMALWNSQPVFAGREAPLRRESDFTRQSLASALRSCSLGLQRDLRPELRQLRVPILWVVGEQDRKFLDLGREVASLNSQTRLEVLAGASHRAPWDRPETFMERLREFLLEGAYSKMAE